jgi:phosphatidylserine decarboxylase
VTYLLASSPSSSSPVPVGFVQIGAMLVGAIVKTKEEEEEVKRGEEVRFLSPSCELPALPPGGLARSLWGSSRPRFVLRQLGYFKYGGSTVIALFPPSTVEFDADLLRNSENKLETVVRVRARLSRSFCRD